MSERQKLLEDAADVVCGEREDQYGNPERSLDRIARLWGAYLACLECGDVEDSLLEGRDVAAMMILLKLARTMSSPEKRDNWLDIAGYAAIGWECIKTELENVAVALGEFHRSLAEKPDVHGKLDDEAVARLREAASTVRRYVRPARVTPDENPAEQDGFEPELFREAEAADYLDLSPRTLQAWRQRGEGPAFLKFGSSVKYDRNTLDKWIDEQRYATAQHRLGVVDPSPEAEPGTEADVGTGSAG